ncbi:N-acetylmuramoyl-L-alanine amidase [Sinirhodobacter sp. WL0062]|uniref:N-acetylmuramoyl-L-alanine amidase n=1 Tax=Rhodobacter flavimaris TaxID=2907145 RepID=A0ABS8YX54_9RHOB|nr:N-acetylmuramoyl-L-alanine amidase [Sinirhodobacter sp. WL0062]MCE5974386.1 N-acetylmuramoyl-L-alanine amidase [Sinirhodobacter sp. WL0062]
MGPAPVPGRAPVTLPSPNFGERRGGLRPELIVIHYTAMRSCAEARARLCDPVAEVSAHWLIAEDGRAEQLVDEAARAWHAGAGAWRGQGDVNSRSIGIELANTGDAPFPEPQMAALEVLLRAIMVRWGIGPEGVIAHSDMAPDRKADPGPRFDWRRLALQGLAVWPEAGPQLPPDPQVFAALAQAFGYPEVPPSQLLQAFRLRFRPRHDGPLDGADMAMVAALAAHYGDDGDQWRAC